MTNSVKVPDNQRLEKKIDDLAKFCTDKFEQISQQFDRIGRLEERISAYMAIAERIESANLQDIRDLNGKFADHEARLRALEAVKPTDHEGRIRTLEAANTASGMRTRIADGAISRYVVPILVALTIIFASEWLRSRPGPQVNVNTPPLVAPGPSKQP